MTESTQPAGLSKSAPAVDMSPTFSARVMALPLPEPYAVHELWGQNVDVYDARQVRAHAAAIAAEADALAEAARGLRVALLNARDIIATDRQGFVDAHQVRGNRVDDAVAHGLVLVSDGVWIDPGDADALRDYDRALTQIDRASAAFDKAAGGAA